MRRRPGVLLLFLFWLHGSVAFSPPALASRANGGPSPGVLVPSKGLLRRGAQRGGGCPSVGRLGAGYLEGARRRRAACRWGGGMAAAGDAADSEGGEIFDAHCHVHLGSSEAEVAALAASMRMGVMSTRPTDWNAVAALCRAHGPRALPAFGLHPWWAHEDFGVEWVGELRRRVQEDEGAIVGEIGLDRKWTPPGLEGVQYEAQLAVFKTQMEVATELGRPVSLHCVHAQGDMFDYCRASPELPPAIYLHSFGGKVGMADNFIKMRKYGGRFYFGFSHMANGRSPKTPDVVARIPDDRLLLESDLEDFEGVRPNLDIMIDVYAEAKGWTREHTMRVTTENACRFYAARR